MDTKEILERAISKRNEAVFNKAAILHRVESKVPTLVREYIRDHAPVLPNIPELIAQELKKLPPRVIEKVLEKETVIKEVPKKDTKKYAEEKSLEELKQELASLRSFMERFKASVPLHGGSGVLGLPDPQGHSGQFLTTDGNQPRWADASSGSSGTLTLGDGITDGSWRITIVGTTLSFQRLESSVWTEKGAMVV